MNATIPAVDRTVGQTDNKPDYAAETTARIAREYDATQGDVTSILNEARALPVVVGDDATALRVGAVVKRIRDLDRRVESYRNLEKEPHLRSSNAIDAFFFGMRDKLEARDRKAKRGAADILADRVADYQDRKLAAEQARLAREAREAEDHRVAAEVEQARLDREAADAAAAAERARKPEIIEQKTQVAEAAQAAATAASVDAQMAAGKATGAHIASLAKPADLVRTRGDDGVTLTMNTEPYAVVENRDLLDYAKLAPFFTLDAVEKALRAWARNTGHTQTMQGAAVGKRPRSNIR